MGILALLLIGRYSLDFTPLLEDGTLTVYQCISKALKHQPEHYAPYSGIGDKEQLCILLEGRAMRKDSHIGITLLAKFQLLNLN